MIYEKYMFGLHPQSLPHSSQNTWNFLSNKSNGLIFGLLSLVSENASGKETFGSHPRVGAGCQENQPCD